MPLSTPRPVSITERVALHHAAVQFLADELSIRILHFKGPAVGQQFPDAPSRESSDVDVFVAADELEPLLHKALGSGWQPYEASPDTEWNHSAVLTHPVYACTVDFHVRYPGISPSAGDVFEALYADSVDIQVAGRRCRVPQRSTHALLLLLHAARNDSPRAPADVALVRRSLGSDEVARLSQLARRLGCEPAVSVVTPEFARSISIEALLWRRVHARPKEGASAWAVRLLEAPTWRAKQNVVRDALLFDAASPGRRRLSWRRVARGLRQIPGLVSRPAGSDRRRSGR